MVSEAVSRINKLQEGDLLVIDVESNGLNPWNGDQIIGYSLGIPSQNWYTYIPVRHGVGVVSRKEDTKRKAMEAEAIRKALSKIPKEVWGNITEQQHNELKEALNEATRRGVVWIGHNLHFDMTFLSLEGIYVPHVVWDTMVGLHCLNEDLDSIYDDAPLKWRKSHANAGRIPHSKVGEWARDEQGNLIWERQTLNKELKFMCAYFELPGAVEGEESLRSAVAAATRRLEHYSGLSNITPISDKSEMWMMTGKEAHMYAEGDTRLTYLLYEYLLDALKDWDAVGVWQNDNAVLRHVAWEAHMGGVEVDPEEMAAQRKLMDERKEYLEALVRSYVDYYNQRSGGMVIQALREAIYGKAADKRAERAVTPKYPQKSREEALAAYSDEEVLDKFNVYSSKLLPVLLNALLKTGMFAYPTPEELSENPDMLPHWWDDKERLSLRTYTKVVLPPRRRKDNEKKEGKSPYITPKVFEGSNEHQLVNVMQHPFVKIIMELRKTNKALGTYLDGWEKMKDPKGILHPNLLVTGTQTGRFSSKAPNIQNIPTRTYPVARILRVPKGTGLALVCMDYSQLELRLAADDAEGRLRLDPNKTMTNLFLNSEDMHAFTRDRARVQEILFGNMPYEQIARQVGLDMKNPEKSVKSYCRFVAKTMNFGLLYGGGGNMLMTLLNIEPAQAEALAGSWHSLFPAFRAANEYYQNKALTWRPLPGNKNRHGLYIRQNFIGRLRRFTYYRDWYAWLNPDTGVVEKRNEKMDNARKAFNHKIQGTGGGITNLSAARCKMELGDAYRPFVILHDSNDFFVPISEMDNIIPRVRDIMQDWPTVPHLSVDVTYSTENWLDQKPYYQDLAQRRGLRVAYSDGSVKEVEYTQDKYKFEGQLYSWDELEKVAFTYGVRNIYPWG